MEKSKKFSDRLEKRKFLKQFLPTDFQLKFIQNKNQSKWYFEGELLKRRTSLIEEDKLFFKILQSLEDKKFLDNIKVFKEKLKKERLKIISNLNEYLTLVNIVFKLFKYSNFASAAKIALSLNELTLAKDIFEKALKENSLDASQIALDLANYDSNLIKYLIKSLFKGEHYETAAKLALMINKVVLAKHLIIQAIDERQYTALEESVNLVIEYFGNNDETFTQEVIDLLFKKGRPDYVGKLALALGDFDLTKQALDECFRRGFFDEVTKLASALVNYSFKKINNFYLFNQRLKIVENMIDVLLQSGKLKQAGELALVLNKFDLTKEIIDQCLQQNYFESAFKLALQIIDKDPKYVQHINNVLLNKDRSLAAKLSLALGKIDLAEQIVLDYLNKGTSSFEFVFNLAKNLIYQRPQIVKTIATVFYQHNYLNWAAELAINLNDDQLIEKIKKQAFLTNDFKTLSKIGQYLSRSFKLLPENQRLIQGLEKLKTNLTLDEKIFCLKMIIFLYKNIEELSTYFGKYLELKNFAEKINERFEAGKKWEKVEDFFNFYSMVIAELLFLNFDLASQMLKNYFARSLFVAQSYLEFFQPVLEDQLAFEVIKKYSKNHQITWQNFSEILEIAADYLKLNFQNKFYKIMTSKLSDFSNLKKELNYHLLKKMAQMLDIQAKISPIDIGRWKMQYFFNLITHQEILRYDRQNLELFQAVLKATFENRFEDFISNLYQKDKLGKQIAEHNFNVEQEFKKYALDWSQWLNYDKIIEFKVGEGEQLDNKSLMKKFDENLENFEKNIRNINNYANQLISSFKKDLPRLKQYKKKNFAQIDFNDPLWPRSLFSVYFQSLDYLQKKHNFTLPLPVQESFGYLLGSIKAIGLFSKEKIGAKKFIVRLWSRDPRQDIFQGNQTKCCLAVGVKKVVDFDEMLSLHPETIFQYLIDKGINVVEVVDSEIKDVVAQVWLLATLDKDNRPILVADNFEVHPRYVLGSNVNRGIRQAVFTFLKDYAQACGFKKVVLGKVLSNDVETQDLRLITLPPIRKLGGFFKSQPYYLETLGHIEAYEI